MNSKTQSRRFAKPGGKAASAAFSMSLLLGLAGCGGGDSSPALSASTSAPAPSTLGQVENAGQATISTPTPAPVLSSLDQAKAWLASTDAAFATSLPNKGTERFRFRDSCYLNSGYSTAYLIKDYDDNLVQRQQENAFVIGRSTTNVQMVAERNSTNTDGTSRLEIDVTYDVIYKDGSSTIGESSTLVSGSTTGSCATPGTSAELRSLGDQRMVSVTVQARNIRTDNFSLTTGVAADTSTRRDIRFKVNDPANVATYAIVTGPGPTGANGQPFSFKLLSPRILRNAPELAGKAGNMNWADTDTFRACRIVGTAVPVAEVADCVGQGATGDRWGWGINSNVADATAQKTGDDTFTSQGWIAGGSYSFAIYADDGWKTVNGQAGKTPIALYTATLKQLPYTFAQMFSATDPDFYPSFTSNLTTAQIAAQFKGIGGSVTLSGLQARAPAGGPIVALSSLSQYGEGVNMGATNTYPRTFNSDSFYPGANATSGNVVIKGNDPETQAKNFGSVSSNYSDRNGRVLIRNWEFF